MMTDAEVIVSGAGPAGSMAAYHLARRGIPTLILEKAHFPRYKVCGAGLTHKILKEIPFDVSEVFETRVHQVIFSRGFREVFVRTSDDPLIYCTMREKLDEFLLSKAVSAGAKVVFGAKVEEARQHQDYAQVVTKSGTYYSRFLIGADGASGAVARSAGLRENIMPGMAWEAEVTADPETVKAYAGTLLLDWGTFPGGYGWVFPKKDHFSIGVGGPASLSKWLMPYYRMLTQYMAGGLDIQDTGCRMQDAEYRIPRPVPGIQILGTTSLKSWPIPVRVEKSRFHNGRMLVAGDAAGLTDPLTGEGIYYAVRSGKLAADACSACLDAGGRSLAAYSDVINEELMNELLEANRIRYLFNTVPGKIHHFVRDSDRAWRAFGKVLRGERWYADVRGGFGKWKMMWGLVCRVASLISAIREKRFSARGF